jgi:N-acetylglutamate synthase-like GNAT family acetyltransferase
MLLGLDVLPEYLGQGLVRELVNRYSLRERANGRKKLFLTCLEQKVEMYKKFGLQDGMSCGRQYE